MNNPSAILFDLDGTLVESLGVLRQAYDDFLTSYGISPSDLEFQSLNGPPLKLIVQTLKANHGLSETDEKLYLDYTKIVDKHYLSAHPVAGAQRILQTARINNCEIGIVTSNSRTRTQSWLAHCKLSDYVNFIVAGDDVTHGKPHPEPYERALEKLSGKSGHCCAVEDSIQGVQSATCAGIYTYLLGNNRAIAGSPNLVSQVESLQYLNEILWPGV